MSQSAVNSPNIKLPVPVHHKDLWSLHGKCIAHFWSAKDRTSRIQNQVLLRCMPNTKAGFEIYMVSIDED